MNVIFKDTPIPVTPGTRVIDVIPPQMRHSACVCRLGGTVRELNYRMHEDNDGETLTLLDVTDKEGGKAYEATLRYLVAMAFHRLYPTVGITFSYNVSRAVFVEPDDKDFDLLSAVEPLQNEVARLVAADLPIERVTLPTEEIIALYNACGYTDKADLLRYRTAKTANTYLCDGYYNYMHAYMLPSTGCIKDYVIRPFSPGLILQYPRYELNGAIPHFNEESTYGRTVRAARRCALATGLATVTGINTRLEKDGVTDLVMMSEAMHNRMLAQLGDAIADNRDDIRLICIAGPSSSGKTTFCNRLRIELASRGLSPVMISMDDYYFDHPTVSRIQGVPMDKLDFEHVNCLDIDRFNRDLFSLINGRTVTLPHFNFKTKQREEGKTITVDRHSPIMIEGIHALNDSVTSMIPKHQKYKVYISPQGQINIDSHSPLNVTDLRLIRRIVRDNKFRGTPPEKTIAMWQSVRNGEFKWIYPNQEGADFVFNSFLPYELCVMKQEILPALKEIGRESPYFTVANRLMKYLKYFDAIDDVSAVPCNSLLREFIGGSCFSV